MPGLPPDFWEREREALAAILRPRIQTMALIGAQHGVDNLTQLGFSIDGDIVNTQAIQWARAHTDEILNQLGTTSSRQVGDIIANWIETPGATMADLDRALLPILDNNAARAWRVGVTETTRAVAEGADIAHQVAGFLAAVFKPPAHVNCRCNLRAKRVNGEWVQVWNTDNDELVCVQPIDTPWGVVNGCKELHNVIVSAGAQMGQKV